MMVSSGILRAPITNLRPIERRRFI